MPGAATYRVAYRRRRRGRASITEGKTSPPCAGEIVLFPGSEGIHVARIIVPDAD